MQLIILAYWLLLSFAGDLLAGVIGALLAYFLSRRRLTRIGALIVSPLGFLAGVAALYLLERLFGALGA